MLELEKINAHITEGVLVSDGWRRRFRAGQVKEKKPMGKRQENKTVEIRRHRTSSTHSAV